MGGSRAGAGQRKTPAARRALLAIIWPLLSLMGTAGARGELRLPDLGESSSAVLSHAQEAALGARFMRDARSRLPMVRDPLLSHYLNHFGDRLVRASDEPKAHFHFFVLRNPVINAFSVPGGYVGVDSGLLLQARNEDELAAVLSHEIAHVTQHHIARMLAAEQRLSAPALGALLAGILVAAAQPQAGEAVIAGTSAAIDQSQINFSRGFEAEADRVGEATMVRAGFNPRAMPEFFERLERWSRLNDAGAPPPFLQDHPVTSERISESLDRALRYPNPPFQDDAAFRRARAEARVDTSDDLAETTRYYRAKASRPGPDQDTARYGLALALWAGGHTASARVIADALAIRHPTVVAYAVLRAQIAQRQHGWAAGLPIYRAMLQTRPDSEPLRELYADTLLTTGQPAQALAALAPLGHPPELPLEVYRLRSRAATDTGHPIAAHEALTDYYLGDDALKEAIEQIRLALQVAKARKDSYQIARLAARLDDLKEQLRTAPTLPK